MGGEGGITKRALCNVWTAPWCREEGNIPQCFVVMQPGLFAGIRDCSPILSRSTFQLRGTFPVNSLKFFLRL